MTIIADIGGTYARFAMMKEGQPTNIQKYKAEDYKTIEEALSAYSSAPRPIHIATAAYPDTDQCWRFVNQNPWTIDPKALTKSGWVVENIMNDFEAASWALTQAETLTVKTLKQGRGLAGETPGRCLIGPGTGLGLGYVHLDSAGATQYVQKTHGGHMPAFAQTPEQHIILGAVHQQNPDKALLVFEDLISGSGLLALYKAQSLLYGTTADIKTPQELLAHKEEPIIQTILRLFHEFFGLCAASAVIHGHAYAGLYLTGGVLEHLYKENLFDIKTFERSFTLKGVDSVHHALQSTPIHYITEPYPALYGLIAAGQKK